MLALLLLQRHGIGFFGQEGALWFFLGLMFLVIVVAIFFKIFKLAMPALGVGEPWASICYWLLVLVCVVLFYNFAVAHWF